MATLTIDKDKHPTAVLVDGEAAIDLKINDDITLRIEKQGIEAIRDYVNMLYACRGYRHTGDTETRYLDENGEWVEVPGYRVRNLEYGHYEAWYDEESGDTRRWVLEGERYLIYQIDGQSVNWVLSPLFDKYHYDGEHIVENDNYDIERCEWRYQALHILINADKGNGIWKLKAAMMRNEWLD